LAQKTFVQPTGQAEQSGGFLNEIQKNIAKALTGEEMLVYAKTLRSELNKVLVALGLAEIKGEPATIAEGLVVGLQRGGRECPIINKALRNSVVDCFDREKGKEEKYSQTLTHHKKIIDRIEQILGYLVLSLVDEQDARDVSTWLSDDLSDLYFELHVTTQGGVELFISQRQQRQANLTLNGRGVTGKYLIFIETNPLSWHEAARLDDIRLVVWNKVFEDENRVPLSEDEIKALKAELLTLRTIERDPANYCVAIRFDDGDDPSYREICAEFLSELEIPMVRFGVKGGKPAFGGLEYNLMSAVRQFLMTINQYVTP
jgi:ribosomal protein L29